MKEDGLTYGTGMTSFYHKTQVGRISTSIPSPSSLFIGIWARHVVCQLSWALEHFAFSIRAVGIFDLLCHSPCVICSMRHSNKIAPRNAVKRMTRCTDLTVNL